MKTIVPFLLLALGCCLLSYSCEKETEDFSQPGVIPPFNEEDLNAATLADVRATVQEGALAFANSRELSRAVHAVVNATPTEVDAWTAGLGFESWGHEYRDIQSRIAQNPAIPPQELLAAAERDRYTVAADGYLRSRAFNRVFGELLSRDGILFVAGDLNYFSRSYHIMIDGGTLADLRELLADPTEDPDRGRFVRAWTSEDYGEATPELVYANCGSPAADRYVYQKTETIDGVEQRLTAELTFFAHLVAIDAESRQYRFDTQLDVRHAQRAGANWVAISPAFEVGTLVAGDAVSGQVSATNAARPLRIVREIVRTVTVAGRPDAPIGRTEAPTGGAAIALRFTDRAEATLLIDNGDTNLAFPLDPHRADTYLEAGRLSVNWLERSNTMDVQLGCR